MPAGGIVALINWKLLFLVSSFLILILIVFVIKINNLSKVSSIGSGILGPALALGGIPLLALNPYLGIFVILTGIILSIKVKLPKEYIKSSFSGFLHSITRNGFAAYLVFLYAYLGYNSLQYGFIILLFPLSFTFFSLIGGKFSDKFSRKTVTFLSFFAIAVFSLSIFVNSILAEILLGIASGFATTSNTSYTTNSIDKDNRIDLEHCRVQFLCQ